VGATDQVDKRAGFSGYGPKTVHLFAPGTKILGAVPGTMIGEEYKSRYEQKDGTSQAVPHVAGVAALIWSVNPELSTAEVKDILIRSVDRLPGGENESVGGGRLNAYRAVLIANGQDPHQADRGLAVEDDEGGGGCNLKVRGPHGASSLGLLLFALILSAGLRLQWAHFRDRKRSRNN
jgi:subtilisin family serine protease